jgi:hypothetical protein
VIQSAISLPDRHEFKWRKPYAVNADGSPAR